MRINQRFLSNRRWPAVLLLWVPALLIVASSGQDMSPQQVGGSSTFDSSANTEPTTGRHRLNVPTVIPEDFSTLKLASGFLLSMDVYDAPELASDLRIDPNGDVTIPTIGRMHLAGETLTEASAQIADHLRAGKILNAPQVSLNIAQYAGQNITVLGEVHNPGRMELLAPHNLADVIALAGGETLYAGNAIEIRHASGAAPISEVIRYARNRDDQTLLTTPVLPGDTITVPRAGIVYVLGGVVRPGGYLMQEDGDLNVTQALSLAYGTNMQAAVSSMRLIRKLPDGRVQETAIPYQDIVKGKVAPPRLQADDVIYVPISKMKVVLGATLLSTAAQAAIYAR
jgi:polysaccharide biosynthesis/export protein